MSAGNVALVEEILDGSELAVDAASGAGTITVEDPTDFQPEGGELLLPDGTTERGYSAVDEATGVITLDTTLPAAFVTGDAIVALPATVERFAHVLLEDQEEALLARVPHALYDRLAVGIRDPNVDELELVELDNAPDGELIVADVLERVPVVDGSVIDPTTLPPPATSDGIPPSVSPTPDLLGGIKSLFVRWLAVANFDLVKYEVHVSTSSGFTPGPGTFAGETPGTFFVIRQLPGTVDPPAYGTTYFVKLIAKDEDGSAAASAEDSATPADGMDDAIIANLIAANAVLAENLEALLVLTSSLVAGTPSGPRVQLGIDADTGDIGLQAYGTDGVTPTFSVDAITGDVFLRGEFEFGVDSRLTSLGGTDIFELMQAPAGSFEQVNPVQSSAGGAVQSGGISSMTRGFAADVQAGNLILVCWVGFQGGGSVASPSAPVCKNATGGTVAAATTLLEDTLYNPTGTENMRQVVYAIAAAPAGVRSIVMTSGTPAPRHATLAVHEFSGVQLAAPADKEKTPMATGHSTVAAATAGAANALADELAFACVAALDLGGPGGSNYSLSGYPVEYAIRSVTHSASWHSFEANHLSSFNLWKRETAVVTSSFVANIDNGNVTPYWLCYIVTFKAKAAGAVPAQTDHVRFFAKDLGGNAYPHVVDESAREGAMVLAPPNAVCRLELATAAINPPSTAAHGAMTAQTASIASLAVGDECYVLSHAVVSGAGAFIFYTTPVITTAGQVTVNGFNTDSGIQDPGSTTLFFLIVHRS